MKGMDFVPPPPSPTGEVSHFTKLMAFLQKWAHDFCKPTIIMTPWEERVNMPSKGPRFIQFKMQQTFQKATSIKVDFLIPFTWGS